MLLSTVCGILLIYIYCCNIYTRSGLHPSKTIFDPADIFGGRGAIYDWVLIFEVYVNDDRVHMQGELSLSLSIVSQRRIWSLSCNPAYGSSACRHVETYVFALNIIAASIHCLTPLRHFWNRIHFDIFHVQKIWTLYLFIIYQGLLDAPCSSDFFHTSLVEKITLLTTVRTLLVFNDTTWSQAAAPVWHIVTTYCIL